MSRDPNAPVIVGAAAVQQRTDDPTTAREAMLLMRGALEAAADDAGSRALLDAASVVLMPQGTWSSANPAQIVAPWNREVRSVVADLGVLQQTLLSRACTLVASGAADVVLVCGGEAKHRALRAQILGRPTSEMMLDTPTTGAPTERLQPAHEIISRAEIERGLPVPARQYAMIDTALRRAHGMTPVEHVDELAMLWSSFSTVAAANPNAWSRAVVEPSLLSEPSTANPMLAWPYTKLHCSQWNVDQAAALIICSVAAAERFGVGSDRWVFAHIGVESNTMVPLTERRELHRSPAAQLVGHAITEHCGVTPADVHHLDLYSCFPAAVRVQAAELHIDPSRQLTVTGGMTFGGGPLNNSTLQSMAAMVHVLRSDPSRPGLVTNVSGMLTKFGASVWSTAPPANPFEALDVTPGVDLATRRARFDADFVGAATVRSYTVACDRGTPVQGIVLAENRAGAHVLATTTDVATMSSMTADDWCGAAVDVAAAELLG